MLHPTLPKPPAADLRISRYTLFADDFLRTHNLLIDDLVPIVRCRT